jgi:hypothetical protein
MILNIPTEAHTFKQGNEPYRVRPRVHGVSNKYVVIDSEKLIYAFMAHGFVLRSIQRGRGRGSGLHIVRMRSTTLFQDGTGSGFYPEIVIYNSYNGKHRFRIEIGVFRLICANGATIKTHDLGSYTTIHLGEEARIAEEVSLKFIEQAGKVSEVVERLQTTILTDAQVIDLALRAARLRWNRAFTTEDAEKLLKAARPEDDGRTAWQVFNVLQEKLENGFDDLLSGQKRKAKAVTAPKTIARVNEGLIELVIQTAFSAN